MFTNHTTNYNLNQWEATDKVLRTEFNADNAKIDAALKANAEAIAAETTARTALAAVVAQRGNCSIERFTYTGTGGFGSGSPTSLNFTQKPAFFVLLTDMRILLGSGFSNKATVISYSSASSSTGVGDMDVTWSGNTGQIVSSSAWTQFNDSGTVYQVFGFSSGEA